MTAVSGLGIRWLAGTSLLAALAVAPIASGADGRVSSSVGYSLADNAGAVAARGDLAADALKEQRRLEGAETSKSRDSVLQSSGYSGFWVYDADAVLYFDEDRDGFYSGVEVSFDVDTDYFAADVYARLYLSLEGGPWIHYFTTDVFTIFGTGGTDDYRVETDLLDGYPTGYYDLLIEVYDYETDEHVASYGPFETPKLSVLPLEDFTKELGIITPPAPPVSQSSGGGGAAGIGSLLALLLLFGRRGR